MKSKSFTDGLSCVLHAKSNAQHLTQVLQRLHTREKQTEKSTPVGMDHG